MSQLQTRPSGETPEASRTWIDRFFDLTGRGTTVAREVRGGITTFVAVAYIVLLIPIILSDAKDVTGTSLTIPQLTTAVALSAALTTILMGVVGNAPFALASGLAVAPVVAFQAAPYMRWDQAMGLVVLEGVVIVIFALTGVRQLIMDAIPTPLKHAIGVGIGMFIALIGLVKAGFVSPDGATPLSMGATGHLGGWPVAVFCAGLLLMFALFSWGIPGAILLSIIVTTVLAIVINAVAVIDPKAWDLIVPKMPGQIMAAPDFSLLFQVDLFGGFGAAGVLTATVVLFTLVLSGFFDAMGTILGVGEEAGLAKDGRIHNLGRILTIDGIGAIVGGGTGASANTVVVESAAGVGEGARTGLAAVVTGLLFGAAMFLTPLAAVVPAQAASPALVLVGALMMTAVRKISWEDMDLAIPAFLTIALMPFTYSITNGVGAGVIAYVLIKTARGRFDRIHWLLWVISLVFVGYFGIGVIEQLFS
ncbi:MULTISPECIES: NCS2 family permease [Streptosporangium]|uniref:AGZA family xanthine/uracil permease-like MFS transporter n=1 Tax=Streptosporangium brasiliense TaxID=47480 RepID=A0ABT9RG13_9ACTN|nr:NCS2 family permease [Streptosporangium brasiliense]MDP9868184.1 AGZA family xanthine/uracil permease-like MFS transporter [Streptosporangium brasiliense]